MALNTQHLTLNTQHFMIPLCLAPYVENLLCAMPAHRKIPVGGRTARIWYGNP